jgi:NAD(P)-dependent dehydrogenase (short-subunit alcohol dehydrogenase family)
MKPTTEECQMFRVSLVTVGSRGIGAEISLTLRNSGYSVAANYAGNDEAVSEAIVSRGRTETPNLMLIHQRTKRAVGYKK